jgi:acetolactate synthase-1/2/3 large subunit
MKISDYVVKYLQLQGITEVFEMSGGMITHLLDSCYRHNMKVVSVHHEQTAAFAADAVGRMTGKPGVAMATSGPGATNLLTGMASCFFDSSPAIFITGQVNRHEQKGTRPVRQLGFQETDIVAMARPITKAVWSVSDPEQLPEILAAAYQMAISGRPGPVLLDIPMDVQRLDIPHEPGLLPPMESSPAEDTTNFLQSVWTALQQAKRPLLLAGGGIRSAGAIAAFRSLVHTLGIPVVHSLMGTDLLAYDDPRRVGMIGSYGNRWANLALGRADVLLVLGSRMDVRQTGADTNSFSENKRIFHVDCDAGELNNRVTGCTAYVANLNTFLPLAVQYGARQIRCACAAWAHELNELKIAWSDTKELPDIKGINPNVFMHRLAAQSASASAYVVDVGQHQMWAAQSLELTERQRFLTSGGMGAMGFALPAAIGAAFASSGEPIVVIAGDGGFQTNIQELQTVVRNKLPVKIIVINNLCHGMVRQFQQSYFHERYQSTLWGYSAPDFARVATAYGMEALTVGDTSELDNVIKWLWRDPLAPNLLQVMIDTNTNVYPKMAFGRPITEMEPFVKSIEMEGT